MLPEVVDEAARRFGDRPAFVDWHGTATSYQELAALSHAVARGLASAGVGPGDVIALRMPSDVPYVLAYLGAARIGAVTAGINPRLAPPEQDALARHVEPAVTLSDADDVRDLAAGGGRVPDLPDDPGRDVAVVFTSGTTGLPKAAVFTNAQLAAITRIDVGDRWGGGGPMLASTQFAHVGFMTKLPWYLRLGSRIHLIERWRAGDVLRLISGRHMTSIGGVAPQLALMLRAPESRTLDFSAVRTIIMGGGPSPPALVSEARDVFDAAYSIRYSSTESGGCGTGTAFDADDDEALHTVGRSRPGIDVSIRDDADAPVRDGEVGEVCVRSPSVMNRYWNDAAATAATLAGGWLHTGDLGAIDERGLLRLAGRRTEMFIRGGYNIHPAEVEAVLRDHPAIADVAVVPRPDDVMGEVGVAVVVARDERDAPDVATLARFLEGRLARFKHPADVVVVDDLPLTPMQKIDRTALAARVAEAGP